MHFRTTLHLLTFFVFAAAQPAARRRTHTAEPSRRPQPLFGE
jgi:hypothetical protein